MARVVINQSAASGTVSTEIDNALPKMIMICTDNPTFTTIHASEALQDLNLQLSSIERRVDSACDLKYLHPL